MFCPSCGSNLTADDPVALLVVCPFCETSVVLDQVAARVAGKMAVLPDPAGPLFISGTGQLLNRDFTVLGRVRYGYQAGFWDEWYLRFDDDDGTAWISQDEENFTLESCSQDEVIDGGFDDRQPGDSVQLGQTTFYLDEKGVAICEGAEGQVPFVVEEGEETPFWDLSTSDAFATVEFEGESGSRVFRGRRVDRAEIVMDYTAEEMGVATGGLAAERDAEDGLRQRVVRDEQRALSLNCYACGAPLEIPAGTTDMVSCQFCEAAVDLSLTPVECANCGGGITVHGGRQAKSLTCAHCHTQLQIKGKQSRVLQSFVASDRPETPFSIGQECTFRGQPYRLVGWLFYHQRCEGESYYWRDYLLHNEVLGYRWLGCTNGHFSWSEEISDRPTSIQPQQAARKKSFKWDNTHWKVIEVSHSETTIEWVEGELPWVAQVGDQISFMDAISPPFLLGAEWTESEIEWFREEYIERSEIAEAFSMPINKLPTQVGVAPNQPYSAGPFRRQSAKVMAIFSGLMLLLSVWSYIRPADEIVKITVNAGDYASEYLTEEFTIEKKNALCQANFYAAVNNDWVYLNVAVVNEEDEAVLDFSSEMSYYHGGDWSEGSTDDSVPFQLAQPGKYRLLVQGEASSAAAVTITIYEGILLTRHFVWLGILSGIWAVIELIRKHLFEAQRWADD
ncbi:MAG: DUF4178 domain-containing protein [Planctomycetales bacterium]